MLLLALGACLFITDADMVARLDMDEDGWATDLVAGGRDCDDRDADRYPGAPELCGGRDEDCDGELSADELDGDGDGASVCEGDCDDADPDVGPHAAERCDNDDVDEDCDGLIDDADTDVLDQLAFFEDVDGDSFGVLGTPGVPFCDPPDGWVALASDCDDSDPAINPFADEVCDDEDVDEDCNNLADDADWSAEGTVDAWPDADADGYGDENAGSEAFCTVPAGWVLDNTDCDDTSDQANPGVPAEICGDGLDNRCDGGGDSC